MSVAPKGIPVRAATDEDAPAIWRVLEPIVRAGDSYALPRDMSAEDALAYWHGEGHEVFVAEINGEVLGTYYMTRNAAGGGAHVCNCGYVTAPWAVGRGLARAMCAHSLAHARALGYRAMQFNLVVSTNERAVKLWQRFGFAIVGRLPEAFEHPRHGFVDAFVMYRKL